MKVLSIFARSAGVILLLSACGGGGSAGVSGPPIVVSVSPAPENMMAGKTQIFSATVTGSANTAVIWSIQEASGGSIAGDGTYTAPRVAGIYHVIAASQADPTKSASVAITVSLPSRFAFVADSAASSISAYSVDPVTGRLHSNGFVASGSNPQSLTTDPFGKFVYAGNADSNSVSGYMIDPVTGALTPVPGSPFAAGTNPYSVVVDPAGKFAYVANLNSDNISAYSIDTSTGGLTTISGSPFPTQNGPRSIAIDPSGNSFML